MRIVVIGGSGLIGSKVTARLREQGHEVLAASPARGVDSVTGEGLGAALDGAEVVVDVANARSFEDAAVLDFFERSGRNLLAAERAAGVGHHLALSVVGSERLQVSGYFRAKLAQESLVRASGVPFTLLRSTQFFEFVGAIVAAAWDGAAIRVSPALVQPIAADEVAAFLAELAVGRPQNGTVEIAGPEAAPLDSFARSFMTATGDGRRLVADVHAHYFGAPLDDRSLTPGREARLGELRFDDWLARSLARRGVAMTAAS